MGWWGSDGAHELCAEGEDGYDFGRIGTGFGEGDGGEGGGVAVLEFGGEFVVEVEDKEAGEEGVLLGVVGGLEGVAATGGGGGAVPDGAVGAYFGFGGGG